MNIRKYLICLIILCLMLTFAGCTHTNVDDAATERITQIDDTVTQPTTTKETDIAEWIDAGIMEIIVFGIGRSDAIVIKTENYTMMIDTGENRHGTPIVNSLNNQGINRIDYLIITHFDSDHVGGAHIVIDNMEVGKVIVPNYSRETNHTERFIAAMDRADIEPFVLTETMRLTLDGIDFIVNPSNLEYFAFTRDSGGEDAEPPSGVPLGDDFSIAVSITHGRNNLLFTGDAMAVRLRELLENEEIISINYDLVKMPRHGRHNANTMEFILATRPRYAVTTGFHPDYWARYYPERPTDERVMTVLDYINAEVFFTMSIGLHVKSDGNSLVLEYIDFFE